MAQEELQAIARSIASMARENFEAYRETYVNSTHAFDDAVENVAQDYNLSDEDCVTVAEMAAKILGTDFWYLK